MGEDREENRRHDEITATTPAILLWFQSLGKQPHCTQ
jgi:hypothetical protein